jgi:hypothetical protein
MVFIFVAWPNKRQANIDIEKFREMTLDRGNHELKGSDSLGAENPRVGKLSPTFEFFDAQARRQQRIRFLRSRENRHRQLADRLDGCTRSHRCKSEADPVCAALYWHKVCRAVSPVLGGKSWTRALIVTTGLSKPYGDLDEIDLAVSVERVRKRLGRSGLRDRIIIGAIDVSRYLKNGKIIGWQLHLDLLIEGNDRPWARRAEPKPSAGTMAPSRSLTARVGPFEPAPIASEVSNALDSAAIALTAGSDEPSAAQNRLNFRLLSSCPIIASISHVATLRGFSLLTRASYTERVTSS